MLKRMISTTGGPAWRVACFAAFVAALTIAPFQANAAAPIHLQWAGLPVLTGKTVRGATPEGAVITGKATGVEADAFLVDVKSTTDSKVYPKGPARVPRAALRRFEMQTKGAGFRILLTVVGSAAGFVFGAVTAWNVQGVGDKHEGAAEAALFGIWGGATAGGYLAGNALDKGWTPVEIVE